MGLGNVAGIFSRRFIIGFFLPAFFGWFALGLLVDPRVPPAVYRNASSGTKVLVIGGIALLTGLLLSGVHYSLLRFFEGYWLIKDSSQDGKLAGFIGRRVGRPMVVRWVRERQRLRDSPRNLRRRTRERVRH